MIHLIAFTILISSVFLLLIPVIVAIVCISCGIDADDLNDNFARVVGSFLFIGPTGIFLSLLWFIWTL